MTKYALVIGIAQYDDPSLRLLPKAAADAEAIAVLLKFHGYHVTRLPRKAIAPGESTIDKTQNLTHTAFIKELKEFLNDRATNQDAVIYFAGHGFRVINSITDEAEGYLAVSNSMRTSGRNAIAISDFNKLIARANFSSLVMLLDCCYAGAVIDQKSLLKSTEDTILDKSNYCLIAACRDFEVSREGPEHGLFTDAVLRGLSSDRAENGVITSSSLLGFVEKELAKVEQEAIYAGRGQSIPIISYRSTARAPTINETCPYQGLKSFDRETAKFFFGRDRIIRTLLQRLEQSAFIPVIGASGSGKSSVVRAGLIPKLEESGWHILDIIEPGIDPISKLKNTLEKFFRDHEQILTFRDLYPRIDADGLRLVLENLPVRGKALLVIDQFEEVFTLCSNENDRRKFIEWLTQVTEQPSRLHIVTTMRADFLEPCLSYRSLAQLIQDWKVLALPMDEQELQAAIVEPAERQGYQLGEGLLDLILEDIRQEKNCLPLLQFALTELWEHRDQQSHTLTLAHYRQMGRVTGALDRHANQVYESLGELEKEWVKRTCLRLIRTGQEEKDTRQRQPKQQLLELAPDRQTQTIINSVLSRLVDGRLFVTEEEGGEAWVDLAHEALMEKWDYFRDWRKEDRELRRLRDRLEDSLRDWHEHHQDANFLISDGFLNQVAQRWTELQPYLPPTAQDFYHRSQERERERLSYSADIGAFKEHLTALQAKLTEKIQERMAQEPLEIDSLSSQASSELVRDDELNKLQAEIKKFLGLAQRFEERMQLAQISADWLSSNQETLAQIIAEFAIACSLRSDAGNNNMLSQEEIQKVYADINRYLDWLRDSLMRGQPVEERLEVPLKNPLTLHKDSYAEAFEFIKREWLPAQLSNESFSELERYVNYLVNYFRFFLD
ncbi:caspase family protein [Leptolyngbya boryana CZ1]|uniref:Caspase family protein n=1 Tax=Leptolyngbya boryana CZ1 TaxID=3060204 RepID=A0AA96WV85_LEPBY|nr:caspase family protein [Leptolyngbya boryana]WNZ46127.1 caspase family protein [Leptolyngbya boryana CZ1]